ncbi:MAG: HAD-IA family hydrolase [Verrucomicrobiota bacterium]
MTATGDRGGKILKPHGAAGKSSRVKRFARFVMRGGRRRLAAAGRLASKPHLLLFDFDGTVADTFQCGLEILNSMATEFRYRRLEDADLPRVRDMRTRELMKFLGIPATRLPKISKRGKEELNKRMDEIHPFPGMSEIVRTLHEGGFRLGILTSNSEENVACFLRKFDLEIFDFIYTSSKLTGKARVIRRILKERKLKPRQVLLVGDEVRDIEAALETGIHMAAVTWGYNSRNSLSSLNPDHVLDTPDELKDLICGLPA